jgi:hypothetical protein
MAQDSGLQSLEYDFTLLDWSAPLLSSGTHLTLLAGKPSTFVLARQAGKGRLYKKLASLRSTFRLAAS